MIQTVFFSLLVLGVAVAAYFDRKERRIPNLLVAAMLVCGFALNGVDRGWAGILHSTEGMLAGGVLLFIFYLRGGMEAGDVKFLAAIGSFVGPAGILVVFIFASIVAGLMAAVELSRAGRRPKAKDEIESDKPLRSPVTIPYGIAISSATVAFVCLRVIL